MKALEIIKEHPYLSGGFVLVAVVLMLPRKNSGGVSDSVNIASINAGKEIAIAQIDARKDQYTAQREMIASVAQTRAQQKVGMAVTSNDRKVDLSRIGSDVKLGLAKTNADKSIGLKTVGAKVSKDTQDFLLGKFTASKNFAVQTNKLGVERELGLRGFDVESENIRARQKAIEQGIQLERDKLPWTAQIANREIDARINQAQLDLMGLYDTNATRVTQAKISASAQETQAYTEMTSSVVDSIAGIFTYGSG